MKYPSAKEYGIDIDYLRRGKESTPEQRLNWLAAAWNFVQGQKNAKKKTRNQRLKTKDQ